MCSRGTRCAPRARCDERSATGRPGCRPVRGSFADLRTDCAWMTNGCRALRQSVQPVHTTRNRPYGLARGTSWSSLDGRVVHRLEPERQRHGPARSASRRSGRRSGGRTDCRSGRSSGRSGPRRDRPCRSTADRTAGSSPRTRRRSRPACRSGRRDPDRPATAGSRCCSTAPAAPGAGYGPLSKYHSSGPIPDEPSVCLREPGRVHRAPGPLRRLAVRGPQLAAGLVERRRRRCRRGSRPGPAS